MRYTIAIFAYLFLASSAFAQNIAQLHQCYGDLGDASVFHKEALGSKGNQIYISQKSVTDQSFLIFSNRSVYRCAYPKENVVQNLINSCHENAKSAHKYNVNLKAGANSYSGVIEVSKEKPMHIQSSLNWVYQTAIAGNKNICNVTCTEELGDETTKLIKTEIAEHIAQAKRVWIEERDRARHQGMSDCNELGSTIKREIVNRFSKTMTTTTGCWNQAQAKADKDAELRREKMVSGLKSCGGELRDLAQSEIDKLEGRPTSAVADGDPEEGDVDPALGKH